jgi:hypothetical protein
MAQTRNICDLTPSPFRPDGVLESVFNSFKAHMILTISFFQGSKGYLQTRHQLGWLFHFRKPASAG